ncbi:hypothetical protein MDS_3482 [Ectopseudomonas mendocina NK-01]|nr:hypothetical protein MDS_3482 [Pseudomonas mendocina NK-01]
MLDYLQRIHPSNNGHRVPPRQNSRPFYPSSEASGLAARSIDSRSPDRISIWKTSDKVSRKTTHAQRCGS